MASACFIQNDARMLERWSESRGARGKAKLKAYYGQLKSCKKRKQTKTNKRANKSSCAPPPRVLDSSERKLRRRFSRNLNINRRRQRKSGFGGVRDLIEECNFIKLRHSINLLVTCTVKSGAQCSTEDLFDLVRFFCWGVLFGPPSHPNSHTQSNPAGGRCDWTYTTSLAFLLLFFYKYFMYACMNA